MGFCVTIDSGGATWPQNLKVCPRADNLFAGAQQQFPFLGTAPHLGTRLVLLLMNDISEAYRMLGGELRGEVGDDADSFTRVAWKTDVWDLSKLKGAANLYGVQFTKETSDVEHPPRLSMYFRHQGSYPTGSNYQAGSMRICLEHVSRRECLDLICAVVGRAGWGSLREYHCHFVANGHQIEGLLGEVLNALYVSEPLEHLAASREPHRESLG